MRDHTILMCMTRDVLGYVVAFLFLELASGCDSFSDSGLSRIQYMHSSTSDHNANNSMYE